MRGTFFGRPKKVPKKGAATSEARGTAKGLRGCERGTPKMKVADGRGVKNRQDTFFDAPRTRSRRTAPPIKFAEIAIFTRLIFSYGWFVGRGFDPSLPPCSYRQIPRRGGSPRPTSQNPIFSPKKIAGKTLLPPLFLLAHLCYNLL